MQRRIAQGNRRRLRKAKLKPKSKGELPKAIAAPFEIIKYLETCGEELELVGEGVVPVGRVVFARARSIVVRNIAVEQLLVETFVDLEEEVVNAAFKGNPD